MKKTKVALLQSVIALLLCCAMLVGTTFAWFTDSVESGRNQIISGSLNVELEYLDKNGEWKPVKADTNVFAEDTLWEPGHAEVVYLRLSNQGNLALKYRLGVTVASETPSINVNGEPLILSKHIQFGVQNDRNGKTDPWTSRSQAVASVSGTSKALNAGYNTSGVLYAEDDCPTDGKFEQYVAMVVYMPESVGNEANYRAGENVPEIMLGLSLVATQQSFEPDNFGSNYDEQSTFPVLKPGSVSEEFAVNNNLTAEAKTMRGEGIRAEVPAGVKVDKNMLTLSVSEMSGTNSNIMLDSNERLRSLDVHMDGVAAGNTVPMKIAVEKALMKGLNVGNFTLYHVENGVSVPMTAVDSVAELDLHNEFYYDPATGDVTLCMATFSEVALVADTENAWKGTVATAFAGGIGTEDDPYIIASADQLAYLNEVISNEKSYGEKHYKLVADINLGGEDNANNGILFYPIGYHKVGGQIATVDVDDAPEFFYFEEDPDYAHSSVNAAAGESETPWYTYGGAFKGIFDGNGHKISNIYQNTWQLKGDYCGDSHYWDAAMGIFGYVYGGTVKNLTVDNFTSDGEFTPTGVIAAYAANATFENIAITKCNPRVYNTGNGGIVGIGGNSTDTDDIGMTFTNITVDNSNTISALWGSWDVACGGIMGMFRGNGLVHFENCHVGAQIDVFNDVCGNYQYYWYRYAGMVIGSLRGRNTIDAKGYTVPDMNGITAEGCTVHFGTWNDYYYCELVANSLASYTHDHQFSRLTMVDSVDAVNKTVTLDGKTTAIPSSGRCNYVVVNGEAGTENATCYHFVNGEVWNHADAGTETVNGKTVLKEDNQHVYLPFNQLFQGDGWGVKHIPVYNGKDYAFEGITILDREVADSVEKFKGTVTELSDGKVYTLDELFTFVDNGYRLVPGALTVSITNKDESRPVSMTFIRDNETWGNGTVTFSGTGAIQITIQDYYFCTPTTIEVNVVERQKEVKFESKFTGDFLYRVGNKGTVSLGTLFEAKAGADLSKATVTVESMNGTAASGVYSQADGNIQFSGTGVVKVTVTDGDYCLPTELILEVVNAKNITSAVGTTTGGDMVLLCDINTSSYVNYWGCTLYGNGFTYTLKGAPTTYSSSQGHGVLITKNAVLDNLVIVGDVYSEYGAYTNNKYYNAAIDIMGDTVIQNSYISGCSAPVLTRANATIINTTLYGGAVANLIIKSGTVTLEDVTTANYDDGRALVGMGIVIHSDATESAKLVLSGKLTQYNFISESKAPSDTYAKSLHNAMFSSNCSQYHFGTSPSRYVNTGIISLTELFDAEDITDNANTGYEGTAVTVNGIKGYVYTQPNTTGGVNNDFEKYEPTTQGAVAPEYSFDFTNKNYVAKTDGSNDYCYEENGKVYISMDDGDTFNWDTSILTVTKVGKVLDYTVSLEGVDYTGKSIAFNAVGDYIVKYTYTDPSNYSIDEAGNIITHSVTYTKTVEISVSVVEAATKHAEFTFGNNIASTTVTVGNNTYVMPNVNGTSSTIGSTTVSGQTIYYPIVEIVMSDGKTSHTSGWYAYFPVLSGAVTITDYKDNGLGDAETFGSSTQSMPDGLSIVGDPAQLFKYQSSSTAGTSPVVKNNILVYSSPSISAKRSEYNTVIQYSYQDNAGATYYYYIGYHAPAQSYSNTCVTADTMVTLADGTQKRIDQVTYADQLLVWDFFNGKLTAVPAAIIFDHGYGNNTVIKLTFSDGTSVKVVNLHQFFDADLNKFVSIDADHVADFVGHKFAKQNGNGYELVTLVDYVVSEEYCEAWGIISAAHYNIFVENMFSTDFMPEDYDLFNYFEVGSGMKFDQEQIRKDIDTYGLYTYDDFADHLTYEQFVAFNVPYFKISVGKGAYTYEGILALVDLYLNN